MGKTAKLHRRLVRKSQETKLHRKVVKALYMVVAEYGSESNWQDTGELRDITEGGIVIGVEPVRRWIGAGSGPTLAKQVMGVK